MSSYAIDLHTHSTGSPDGSLTLDDYQVALATGLDYVAITDHDSISRAVEIRQVLGEHIIVGQEITTSEGELVGLFLTKRIDPHQTALQTAKAIRKQGGLVYVPHPFETVRKGLPRSVLDTIATEVDIVETFNGRAVFQNKGSLAQTWTRLHNKVGCASSDAHGRSGLGTCFTTISDKPTVENLVKLLTTSHVTTARPPLCSLFYPKLNRFRGKIHKRS